MKLSNLLVLGSMAVMGAAFTSCSKDIAYDSEGLAKEATQKLIAEYDANFVKKYGAIDPNQTWDFATMTPIRTLPSTGAATRGVGDPITVTPGEPGTITIKKDIINWMHDHMKAGEDHSQVGAPFASVTSRNSFIIAPFYQGQAGYFWELWVNIGGYQQKIWQKYETLQYKGADGRMHDLTTAGVPSNAEEVVAPTYPFTATEGATMYFFLKVWRGGDSAHTSDGSGSIILSSLDDGNMRALENVPGLPMPAGVPSDYFAYIIGCEDNNADGSDGDFEDLAFLFFGPPMTDVTEVEDRETKRYMMEDLGDTDDFDFNDVVVDVSEVSKKEIYWKENISTGKMEKDGEAEIDHYQEAIVRAAGGIYNFTLKIGNTEWSKKDDLDVPTMWNTGKQGPIDYSKELAKFKVTGWNKDTNNITLTVHFPDGDQSPEGSPEEQVLTITFPKKGTAPKMIAVNPTWNWTNERIGVPSTWWYE